MMNDRIIYELLYDFIYKSIADGQKISDVIRDPTITWESFWVDSSLLDGKYTEIYFLIANIAKEIDRKDKMKCQFCRIDEGLLTSSPVKAEDLCKKHRQEYEEQYIDRTLNQMPLGIGAIIEYEGKR